MNKSVSLAFVVYCLLASAAWITAPFTEGRGFFERQAILYGVVAVGAFLFLHRRPRSLRRGMSWARLGVSGVGFFGGAACLIQWAASGIPAITVTAIFAVVPSIVVLVLVIGWAGLDEQEGWGFLVPALAGFGGVLLLLPVGLPGSVRGQVMLVVAFVAAILVSVSGVWMHRLMKDVAIAEAVALVCFANAVFLVICGFARRDFVVSWNGLTAMFSLASCIDLIQIILVFWLLREMSPVRFATRYLVIPLLTIIQGYVVLRPELTVRMVVGMGLLAGGSAWVLFGKTTDDDVILSLR